MTFSMLARCADTGHLGVAVATSDLAVGARVPYAEPGVGVAVTQHRTDPRLGPRMLELVRDGAGARDAVNAVAAETPHRWWRQLAVLTETGDYAAYAGEGVTPAVAMLPGDGCLVVGNMLASSAVAQAVATGFAASSGELAGRLVSGLQAGLEAGGEVAPLRSAALVVVGEQPFPVVDLRIDDDLEPLTALEALWRSYAPWKEDFVRRALEPDAATGEPDGAHAAPISTTT
jgi:uncharacterized Ntn-hydrolase superfamily protein